MNINEIRIEKIIILLLALFGIILFIDYTFGISNVIQIYYKNKNLSSFKRDLFLCLYTISIIPCIGFYSLCNFDKNSNKEPELMLNIIRNKRTNNI